MDRLRKLSPGATLLLCFVLTCSFSFDHIFVKTTQSLIVRFPHIFAQPSDYIKNHAGEKRVLSPLIVQALELLDENDVKEFGFPDHWRDDITHFERIQEASYPRYTNPKASLQLLIKEKGDQGFEHCQLVAEKEKVKLVRCS